MTKEEQKKEAIFRIQELTKKFNLNSNMLDFFKNGKIYGLDYVENSKIQDRSSLINSIIINHQVKYNSLVYYYFIVDINLEGYDLEILNIFYVGQHPEDWELERLSEDNEMYICTYELSSPNNRELGFVKVNSVDGNLIRVS